MILISSLSMCKIHLHHGHPSSTFESILTMDWIISDTLRPIQRELQLTTYTNPTNQPVSKS
jgi:hypothetical protein